VSFEMKYAICVALLFSAVALAETTISFKTRLSPVAMDASMRATILGSGSAGAVLTGSKLVVTGLFEGLASPATTAQLHESTVTGVRGPAVLDLIVSKATSGALSGSFELTPRRIATLRKGRIYIQLQSEKAPDGNLWGWLLPDDTHAEKHFAICGSCRGLLHFAVDGSTGI
jgi:hypothetical protein